MAELEELAAVQQAHHAQLLAVRQTSAGLIEEAWDAYAGLDSASAAAFTEAAAQITTAAQKQTAVLAVGYMAENDRILGEAAELVPRLSPIRGGVPPAQVFERSIVQARTMVANGAPVDQALAAGRARAASAARTDVIAQNRAAINLGGADRPWVVGYRRVLTGKSCALCASASTQRYKFADLQPIHASCDCDVAEIYGREDPGSIINRDLLEEIKQTTGRPDYWNDRAYTFSESGEITYRKVEYLKDPATGKRLLTENGSPRRRIVDGDPIKTATRDHGELGKVLTDKRHAFTSADEIADVELPRTPPRPEPIDAPPAGARAAADVADEIPAKVVKEAADEAPPRIKPTNPESRSVQDEARRRNVSAEQVAQERDAKKIRQAQERRRAKAEADALTADSPEVIRVAELNGVSPDEVMIARERVGEVRGLVREEAARVQQEMFDRLYQWNETKIKGPGTYSGSPPAEYDWFRGLDQREKSRLSRKWFDNSDTASAPDVFAKELQANDRALGALDYEDVIDEWLDVNRRYEAAGAMRRGKLPSARAYSDQIDLDTLLAEVSDRGYSAERILSASDDLDLAGHIAGADAQMLRQEALDYLGDALTPRHGESPYRMSFQRWEEEVRELEYGLRNYPTEMPANAADRLAELVPRFIDEPGIDYEELYTRIVSTARLAREEVPSYARIPWQ